MRVLICGGRHFYNWRLLEDVLYNFEKEEAYDTGGITEIIQGVAQGADMLARQWGIYHKKAVYDYPADWVKYGKKAGPIRNTQMLKANPDYVIAFLAPDSTGTKNMIEQATKAGVPVKVVNIGQ